MSALLAALVAGVLLTPPSADAAMQTLLKAAVTLRTFDHFAGACTRGPGFDASAVESIADRLRAQSIGDGAVAVSVTKTSEAQFVTSAPEQAAAPAAGEAAAPITPTAPATLSPLVVTPALLASIDSTGFDTRAGGELQVARAKGFARGTSTGQRGTCRIDRRVPHITWDDGTTAQHILITDPDDPKGAIWIDGQGYARRDE